MTDQTKSQNFAGVFPKAAQRVLFDGPLGAIEAPADEPARLLEIISPGGFADFLRGVGEMAAAGPPDPAEGLALADRFHLSIDSSSVPGLEQRHGLRSR